MKLLILLGFAACVWAVIAAVLFATVGMADWSIVSAGLAVLLWFISSREASALREREEDRSYYQHPRF